MTDKSTSPPPAYFLSLSLENVRSFGEKQTISFARPDGRPAQWTIILGDNGVGKTTVLKSLAAILPKQSSDGNYQPAMTSWQALWMPLRHEGEEVAEIEFSIQSKAKLTTTAFETNDAQVITRTFRMFNPNKRTEEIRPYFNNLQIELQDIDCFGYGAGRTVGNSTLSEIPDITDNCNSIFDDRANLLNPEEWFLQMEYSSLKQDNQAAKSLEHVRQVLLQVLPDVTAIRIASRGYQQYLELETPYGWVRLRDMSLGYQTLVVWLTDFASKLFIRYPESANPLEEPAIVLIDEIDLHLHPEWQRKLIGFLSGIFKNTQFIATAHSPLVVQAAGDAGANVVLLRREGDQTVVVKDLPDVRRWRIEQILSSELFEDTSPLSPQTEADLKLRNELLLKKRPTAKDKAELERVNALFGELPVGTTRPERRAEDLLAQLARNLGKSDILE